MQPFRRTIVTVALLMLAGAPIAADEVTVASFVQRLAGAKSLEAEDGRLAVASLRAAGIAIPTDMRLEDRLTEGDVAEIARTLGLDVSTNRPDRVFSSEQVDQFFSAFRVKAALRGELRPAQVHSTNGGPGFDPLLKGRGARKGKKKDHGSTPAEPE